MENANTIEERRSKIVRNRVFDCHLLPHWRQMAIENTVSINSYPHSSIVDSFFDCRLPGVYIVYNSLGECEVH